MMYSLEMVALTKAQEEDLVVAELNILKFSFGVRRMNKIRNQYFRGTTQVEQL